MPIFPGHTKGKYVLYLPAAVVKDSASFPFKKGMRAKVGIRRSAVVARRVSQAWWRMGSHAPFTTEKSKAAAYLAYVDCSHPCIDQALNQIDALPTPPSDQDVDDLIHCMNGTGATAEVVSCGPASSSPGLASEKLPPVVVLPSLLHDVNHFHGWSDGNLVIVSALPLTIDGALTTTQGNIEITAPALHIAPGGSIATASVGTAVSSHGMHIGDDRTYVELNELVASETIKAGSIVLNVGSLQADSGSCIATGNGAAGLAIGYGFSAGAALEPTMLPGGVNGSVEPKSTTVHFRYPCNYNDDTKEISICQGTVTVGTGGTDPIPDPVHNLVGAGVSIPFFSGLGGHGGDVLIQSPGEVFLGGAVLTGSGGPGGTLTADFTPMNIPGVDTYSLEGGSGGNSGLIEIVGQTLDAPGPIRTGDAGDGGSISSDSSLPVAHASAGNGGSTGTITITASSIELVAPIRTGNGGDGGGVALAAQDLPTALPPSVHAGSGGSSGHITATAPVAAEIKASLITGEGGRGGFVDLENLAASSLATTIAGSAGNGGHTGAITITTAILSNYAAMTTGAAGDGGDITMQGPLPGATFVAGHAGSAGDISLFAPAPVLSGPLTTGVGGDGGVGSFINNQGTGLAATITTSGGNAGNGGNFRISGLATGVSSVLSVGNGGLGGNAYACSVGVATRLLATNGGGGGDSGKLLSVDVMPLPFSYLNQLITVGTGIGGPGGLSLSDLAGVSCSPTSTCLPIVSNCVIDPSQCLNGLDGVSGLNGLYAPLPGTPGTDGAPGVDGGDAMATAKAGGYGWLVGGGGGNAMAVAACGGTGGNGGAGGHGGIDCIRQEVIEPDPEFDDGRIPDMDDVPIFEGPVVNVRLYQDWNETRQRWESKCDRDIDIIEGQNPNEPPLKPDCYWRGFPNPDDTSQREAVFYCGPPPGKGANGGRGADGGYGGSAFTQPGNGGAAGIHGLGFGAGGNSGIGAAIPGNGGAAGDGGAGGAGCYPGLGGKQGRNGPPGEGANTGAQGGAGGAALGTSTPEYRTFGTYGSPGQVGADGQVAALNFSVDGTPIPVQACDFPGYVPLPHVGLIARSGAGCDRLIHDMRSGMALITPQGLAPTLDGTNQNVYSLAEYQACHRPGPPRPDRKELTATPITNRPTDASGPTSRCATCPHIPDPLDMVPWVEAVATNQLEHELVITYTLLLNLDNEPEYGCESYWADINRGIKVIANNINFELVPNYACTYVRAGSDKNTCGAFLDAVIHYRASNLIPDHDEYAVGWHDVGTDNGCHRGSQSFVGSEETKNAWDWPNHIIAAHEFVHIFGGTHCCLDGTNTRCQAQQVQEAEGECGTYDVHYCFGAPCFITARPGYGFMNYWDAAMGHKGLDVGNSCVAMKWFESSTPCNSYDPPP